MHAKTFTLALAAVLTMTLVGCSDEKPRRAAKKSPAPTTSETPAPSTAGEKSTAPAETTPSASAPATGDWGTLKGKFVFNGTAPKQEPLKEITQDQAVCTKHPLLDESLVVADDGGVANIVVWVRNKDVKVHSDYDALKEKKVVIDNKNCRFDPHVVTYWTGQPLEIKNSDPVAHNTNASCQVNEAFNEIIPAEKSSDRKPLTAAEMVPVDVSCNIHRWMKGWLVVQANPYMAVSGKDGSFELKNLPTGTELEFQVWQEKAGYVQKAEVGGKDAGWAKGRFKYTVKPGDNDLGTIKLDAAQFNK
jgi:plastocyanin